jgi:hypothetical protein
MTVISCLPSVYSEAYRLADNLVAGDITKFMAVPWQADFFECNTHWWPAQRPDSVITAKSVEELEGAFSYERKQGELDRLMLVRQPWARGIETARPDPSKIESVLFSQPNPSDELPAYIDRLCKKLSSVFSEVVKVWQPVKEPLPERVPRSGRIQFLVQEQFDRFGGRYFHFVVPSPEEASSSQEITDDKPARKTAGKRSAEKLEVAGFRTNTTRCLLHGMQAPTMSNSSMNGLRIIAVLFWRGFL